MAIQTFAYEDVSVSTVIEELDYTIAALKADDLTVALAVPFDALRATGITVHLKEIDLRRDRAAAQARVTVIDGQLDREVERFSNSVKIITNNDKNHPITKLYFGTRSAAQLKRFVLGPELATVLSWIDGLNASSDPTLKAFGASFGPITDKGTAAETGKTKAAVASKEYKSTGPRKTFLDQANALRALTHGKLGDIAHTNGLSNDYPDAFFRHASAPVVEQPEPDTVESLKAAIQANTDAGTDLASRLATLQATIAAAATKQGKVVQTTSAVEAAQKALDAAKEAQAKAQQDADEDPPAK